MGIGSLVTVLIVAYIVAVIWLICHIILKYDNSNPVKTVGWIFAVIFFPVIGMIIYYVAGRNLRKRASLFDTLRVEMKNMATKPNFGFELVEDVQGDSLYTELQSLLNNLCQLPLFPGNKIDLYNHGSLKFKHMIKDIENAKSYIHLLYYTFGGDEIGTILKELLIKKRKEGVEVRLLYDDVGSNQTDKKFFEGMREAGIEVAIFSPVLFPRLLKSINYRNHKKIVVIDGKIGYTGGINVKDNYIKGVDWGVWRDVHCRIKGPGAQGLQAVFLTDWYYTYNQYLCDDKYFPPVKNYGNSLLQVATAEPLGEKRVIMQGMFGAITRARKSIYIETPYFVPTGSILTALQCIAMSGVEVHLVLPQKSDNNKVQYASNSYIEQLLYANVKVYLYKPGFIHSKLMVIDDDMTILGSSNMDIRSFDLNFETNVFIYDRETSLNAKEIILNDIADCEEIKYEDWLKRSKFQEFKEAFFKLFSPFL